MMSAAGPHKKRCTPGLERLEQRCLLATILELGGGLSPRGINDLGQVVLNSSTDIPPAHTFLWTPTTPNGTVGVMSELGTIFDDATQATGINYSGEVVGYSTDYSSGHAFLWTPLTPNGTTGTMTDLSDSSGLGNAGATAINDAGQVVGYSEKILGRAFLYSNGTVAGLGTLGGPEAVARAINDSGEVVGSSHVGTPTNPGAGNYVAFLYSGGAMISLGTLGSIYSDASGINDSGEVVGSSRPGTYIPDHAFLWPPPTTDGASGVMTDLGTSFKDGSRATAINNAGQVVGYVFKVRPDGSEYDYSAFFYSQKTGMIDLNSLVPQNTGWVLNKAYAINNRGQIVGDGTRGAFLLSLNPDMRQDIHVTGLDLDYTKDVVIAAMNATFFGNRDVDVDSSTFDLNGVASVTNSADSPSGPFSLTVFSSAGNRYDPVNDPSYRELASIQVPSLAPGQALDVPLTGVKNPMLFHTPDGMLFYDHGFHISAIANPDGEVSGPNEENDLASIDPATAQATLASALRGAAFLYDQSFRVAHGGSASSAAAALSHYLDASGTPFSFGDNTAQQVSKDYNFSQVTVPASVNFLAQQFVALTRSGPVSRDLPQSVTGTPELGTGTSGAIPLTDAFDLKIAIHGTQGSSGSFDGTAEIVGVGAGRRIHLVGRLTITLTDVYEFDKADVALGGFNVIARSLAAVGLARSFGDSVTVRVPIDELIAAPQSGKVKQESPVTDPVLEAQIQEIADTFGWSIIVINADGASRRGKGKVDTLRELMMLKVTLPRARKSPFKERQGADFHVVGLDDSRAFDTLKAWSGMRKGYQLVLHGRFAKSAGARLHLARLPVPGPSIFGVEGLTKRRRGKYTLIK